MTNNVESVIKSVIAEQFAFSESELTHTTHLHEEIGVDSVAFIELAIRLEDAFLIKLNSLDKLKTVGDIMNCVSSEIERTH